MIYISTGGFKYQTAYKTSKFLAENGFLAIELSGGIYEKNQLKKLKDLQTKYDIQFKVHNYFPPPLNPFVFNLGSLNKDIARLSIQHVKNAIDYSKELRSDVYSFHAGFLLDPGVSELGETISSRQLYDRTEAMKVFIERVNDLSIYALSKKVSLLIENNVISSSNYKQFFGDPLLMTNKSECIYIMENTPSNVNLLVDVGHLKVSSQSLGLDAILFLTKCKKWIKAYHFSENNGMEDENKEFDSNSWFWPHIINGLDYYSLEVYTSSLNVLSGQCELAEAKVLKS
jgi:sugar phosphate isomerase/epimerase